MASNEIDKAERECPQTPPRPAKITYHSLGVASPHSSSYGTIPLVGGPSEWLSPIADLPPAAWGSIRHFFSPREGRRCGWIDERGMLLVPLVLALMICITLSTYPRHPVFSLADQPPQDLTLLGKGGKVMAPPDKGHSLRGPTTIQGITFFNLTNPNFFPVKLTYMDVSIFDFKHSYIGHATSSEPVSIPAKGFSTLPASINLSLGTKETARVVANCAENGHRTNVYLRGRAVLHIGQFFQRRVTIANVLDFDCTKTSSLNIGGGTTPVTTTTTTATVKGKRHLG